MKAKKKAQRVIHEGNSATGQKQAKAQIQKDGNHLFHK